MAIERLTPVVQIAKVENSVDLPQQVANRNPILQTELVKELELPRSRPTIMTKPPSLPTTMSQFADYRERFFNSIDPIRTSADYVRSAVRTIAMRLSAGSPG